MKKIFSLFSLWIFSITLLGIVLAISGIFWKSLIVFGGLLFLFLFILWGRRSFQKESLKDKGAWVLLILFLAWVSLSFNFSEPTVFSGRDQGSFSEAAIRLAKNEKLEFSFPAEKEFFNIYGEGRAYNFPGFSYTSDGMLKTQFSLGYVSYLAEFYSIFGLLGLKLANPIAIFIFLFSFYFLSRKILKRNVFLPSIFVLSSFLFLWFSKFTLGENLALALLWFSILNLFEFWEKSEKWNFFLASLGLALLIFVRIEALAIIGAVILIFWIKNKKLGLFLKQIGNFNLAFWLMIGAIFFAGFAANIEFYIFVAKGFFGGFKGNLGAKDGIIYEIIHTFSVFSAYSLIIFLAFSILGINYLFRKKDWQSLLPLFVISPTIFFLLDPNISDDHPWMLRRFLYSLIPTFFLYSSVFLETFFKKKQTLAIFSGLLVFYNLLIFIPYATFIPNKGLLNETEELSEKFSSDDLVLVDRFASGDPYSMLSGPLNSLFGKQAVYFFNPEDLSKINLGRFSRVLFIIPDDRLDFYNQNSILKNLVLVENYHLDLPTLKNVDEKKRINLPAKETLSINGGIYEFKKL